MHENINDHEHLHGHEHDHEHHHHDHALHEGGADTLTAVLKYMLDHNMHHADELKGIAAKLQEQGKAEAAKALGESTGLFDAANEKLAAALRLLGE